MRSWYVVYTHPREEQVAEENLARQGYVTYWPRYRRRVSHARKVQEVRSSLFPRYLFAAFDPVTTGWRAIRSTRGVIDIIRNGHEPTEVPASLIEQIRRREDEAGCVVLGRQVALIKGQRIALKGDAFKGHELIFETMKDSERVVALLSMLGREFKVEIPIASIQPAGMA
jgi:transcriptional antiterminator RfaH